MRLLLSLLIALVLRLLRLLYGLLDGLRVVVLLFKLFDLLLAEPGLLELILDLFFGLLLQFLLLFSHLIELVGHILKLLLQELFLGLGHALEAIGQALQLVLSRIKIPATHGVGEAVGGAAFAGVQSAHLVAGLIDTLALRFFGGGELVLNIRDPGHCLPLEFGVRKIAVGQRGEFLKDVVGVGFILRRLVGLDFF